MEEGKWRVVGAGRGKRAREKGEQGEWWERSGEKGGNKCKVKREGRWNE